MDKEKLTGEKVERLSKIWVTSRKDGGKTQEFMAKGLGVSKKTVQNWERGISLPNMLQVIEWFRLLGLNPMHYYLAYIYPWLFDNAEEKADDSELEDALITLIKQFTPFEKQQLLYLITGKHGSSWYSLLQMFTAHCHTTMQARVAAARVIYENYEMQEETGALVCPDKIRPDLKMLENAISQGKSAVMNNEFGYNVVM